MRAKITDWNLEVLQWWKFFTKCHDSSISMSYDLNKFQLFSLMKTKVLTSYNMWFLKVIVIEFRLQFRHTLSLSCPIWWFFLPWKCHFYAKNVWFLKVIWIEFRLQFRHTLSLSHPILAVFVCAKLWFSLKSMWFWKVVLINVVITFENYAFFDHFEV